MVRFFLTDKRGLTLIELMAAVSILAVALVPLVGIMTGELRWTGKAKDSYAAMQLANEKLEEIQFKLRTTSGPSGVVPQYHTAVTDYPLGFTRTVQSATVETPLTSTRGANTWYDHLEKYTVTVKKNGVTLAEVTLLGTEANYYEN